eukprot:IDg13227t1
MDVGDAIQATATAVAVTVQGKGQRALARYHSHHSSKKRSAPCATAREIGTARLPQNHSAGDKSVLNEQKIAVTESGLALDICTRILLQKLQPQPSY